jgi:hypothetical protein
MNRRHINNGRRVNKRADYSEALTALTLLGVVTLLCIVAAWVDSLLSSP